MVMLAPSKKVGPKEAQVRALRETGCKIDHDAEGTIPKQLCALCNPALKRRDTRAPSKPSGAGVSLAPPVAVQKAIAADLAEESASATTTKAMVAAVDEPKKTAAAKPTAKQKESGVKKSSIKKAVKAAKQKPTPKAKIKAKGRGKRAGVPALDVAAFVCRKEGASMAEMEKKFGIDAHPMRAKIFYIRHELGYKVETKDGRYFGTEPRFKAVA